MIGSGVMRRTLLAVALPVLHQAVRLGEQEREEESKTEAAKAEVKDDSKTQIFEGSDYAEGADLDNKAEVSGVVDEPSYSLDHAAPENAAQKEGRVGVQKKKPLAAAMLETEADVSKTKEEMSSEQAVFSNAHLISLLRQRIENIVFKDDMLLVPRKILFNFGKGDKCNRISDYTIAEIETPKYQCEQGDMQYEPPLEIRRYLENFAGGPGGVPAQGLGKWCSDTRPDMRNGTNGAKFWSDCVIPKSGFFNVLRCKEDNVYATIGLSALNRDTCIPLHSHNWEEVYWPIRGHSTWRKWKPGASLVEERENRPHFMPSNTLREVETGHRRSDLGQLSVVFRAYYTPDPPKKNISSGSVEQSEKVMDGSCWHRFCSTCGTTGAGAPRCDGNATHMGFEDDGGDYDPDIMETPKLREAYGGGFLYYDYSDLDGAYGLGGAPYGLGGPGVAPVGYADQLGYADPYQVIADPMITDPVAPAVYSQEVVR